jgi:hypothetical protein
LAGAANSPRRDVVAWKLEIEHDAEVDAPGVVDGRRLPEELRGKPFSPP